MLSSRRKQDGKKILYKWQTNHNRRQLPLLVFKMITIMHMGGKLHGIKSLYKWGQWIIKERFLASHCGNRRANSYLANVVQLFNIFGVRYPNSTNSWSLHFIHKNYLAKYLRIGCKLGFLYTTLWVYVFCFLSTCDIAVPRKKEFVLSNMKSLFHARHDFSWLNWAFYNSALTSLLRQVSTSNKKANRMAWKTWSVITTQHSSKKRWNS